MRVSIRVGLMVVLVAVSCTSGGPDTPSRSPEPSTIDGSPSVIPSPPPPRGGRVVFGAEQWPECVNPITSCGEAWWTWYSVLEHVLPRAMQLDLDGNFVASPLLVEAPTLENGGLSQDPFTVRFAISDEAVWEDGTPITSADFAFTWRAIVSTRGATRTAGYDLVEDVDTTDPKRAVIRFADVYADWADLFGGAFGFVLKAAAFPNEAGEERPDLGEQMIDTIPFSGGPWILQSWSQDQAVLVRNDHYFGPKAILDQVTMVPRTDQSAEVESILAGEIQGIYPSASDVSLLDNYGEVAALGGDGLGVEAVMFNLLEPPLDDSLVRQAILFSLDRQAVIDQLITLNNPEAEVLDCGFVAVPRLGPWCRTQPFGRYTYDPGRARSLLEQAGFDCSSTPCTKGGKGLRIDYFLIPTNTLRTESADILIDAALEAGIELREKYLGGSVLFGEMIRCPFGFISQCVQVPKADPSVTELFGCDQIPSEENDFGGRNWTGWCNLEADRLMHQADRELDPAKRLDLLDRVYELQAEDAIGIPLFVRPAVSVWRPDQIAGPIGLWNGTPYGLFFNMNEWYVAP